MKLSKISAKLEPSSVLKFSEHIKQMVRNGESVYNLTIGDFDPSIFSIPKELEESIIQAYRDGLTTYPSADGNLDLRISIKNFIKDFQGLYFNENEIMVGSGGRSLIYALFIALCDEGDEIVYPVPCWNNCYYTQFVGGKHIEIETTEANRFMPTAAEIEPFIKTTTLIALCSPQNPTGTIFTESELGKICDLVIAENERRGPYDKKLYVLFDQMYSQLVYGTGRHFNPVGIRSKMKDYTITVDAISKSFASTGVRVGWCMAPVGLIDKMKAIITHVGAWAPMPEQKGLASYLGQTQAIKHYLENFKFGLLERLMFLYAKVKELKAMSYPIDAIKPEGAVFLSLKIDIIGLRDSEGNLLFEASQIAGAILKETKIALIPFFAFGSQKNKNWFRISVGNCKMKDLGAIVNSLQHFLHSITEINRPALKPISQLSLKNKTGV